MFELQHQAITVLLDLFICALFKDVVITSAYTGPENKTMTV
jgi:hypothetical protein